MVEKGIIIITNYVEEPIQLNELCDICHITIDDVQQLIAHDLLHPEGDMHHPKTWLFSVFELQRVKRVLRLQRDLNINLEGIVVILDLLKEMERMREEMLFYEKHYL